MGANVSVGLSGFKLEVTKESMDSVDSRNYYELLGVSQSSSIEEIKQAYREVSKIFHPDSNFFSEIVEDKAASEDVEIFQRITQAYQTLIDAEKRRLYDDSLPKNLRGWDDDGRSVPAPNSIDDLPDYLRQSARNRKPTLTTLRAFGTLREGPDGQGSTFDGIGPQRMSQIINVNPGLFSRLKRFFGIR